MMTSIELEISSKTVDNYFKSLIGQFYKILPMKEDGEPTLSDYILNLQRELLGCQSLIPVLQTEAMFITLLSILEYLKIEEREVRVVKSQVFKAITICKNLRAKYREE